MPKIPQHYSTTRFLRAYFLTARILLRYLSLVVFSKILGPGRMQGRWLKAHVKTARQIKSNILELKGLFIKVGQMISIMTQFLPETITQELEGLQDAVPPAPYSDIEHRFRDEFKKSPTEYFKSFQKTPMASASLGQVHEARTQRGEKVAVKVQYPDIEAIVKSDLKTLKRIFGLLNLIFPRYGLKKTYREIREVILEELDFKNEGKNLERLQANFSEEPDLIFPKVFWESSTSRVLTLEFMEGVKISNLAGLRELGVQPSEVAKKIIHIYCKQIFLDGVYHADPHPGNFLIRAREEEVEAYVPPPEEELDAVGTLTTERRLVPQIIMMDFGAVARISDPMRQGIGRFLEGVIKRDTQIIAKAMKEMGFISKTQEEEVFDRIVEFFYERLKDVKVEEIKNFKLDRLQNIEELLEFRKMDISFKDLFQSFNVPKDWAILERTLILLVGLTTHLDPNIDPLAILIPYAEQFVLGKDRTFADLILETVKEVALGYLRLPTELQRTLRRLNQGQLETSPKQSRENVLRISRALNRLTYALLLLGGMGFGYTLQREGISEYQWSYYVGGFFGILLAINLLRKK